MAQSPDSKWYFGFYRNTQGEEIAIYQDNIIFLNQDRPDKDIATFCTYSEQSGGILAIVNEIGYDYGIMVLNPQDKTASYTFEFMVDDLPDGSTAFKPVEGSALDSYKRVSGLGSSIDEKVQKVFDQRNAILKENNAKISDLIENNSWLKGVWVSSDKSTACAVLSNGFVIFGSFEERITTSPMRTENGRIYIPCNSPSENGVIIDLSAKKIETFFGSILNKIAPK